MNLKKIIPLDLIFLDYILTTLLIIVMAGNNLDNKTAHIISRILMLVFLGVTIYVSNKQSSVVLDIIRNLYPLIFIGYFYHETDYLNNLIFANYFDTFLAQWEISWFGAQSSLMFNQLYHQQWIVEIMYFSYSSYFLIITGTCLYVYFKNKTHYKEFIFIVVCSFFIYYYFFIAFPSAGPQYYFPEFKNPGGFFPSILAFIRSIGEAPTGAFPSSHVGISAIITYLIFRYAKKIFPIILFLFIMLSISTVYTGSHYVIDVVFGVIAAPGVYFLSKLIYRIYNKLIVKSFIS